MDFLLRAPSEDKSLLVTDFINDYCYGKATAISDDDGHRISVRIMMPITQHVICSVSGFMACLSKLYDLEYDGWGSVIQKNT